MITSTSHSPFLALSNELKTLEHIFLLLGGGLSFITWTIPPFVVTFFDPGKQAQMNHYIRKSLKVKFLKEKYIFFIYDS